MNFINKLKHSVSESSSTLCVGLDPNLNLLPKTLTSGDQADPLVVESFLKRVIEVTCPYCAAYKPNMGFFEALGPDGWDCLAEVLDYIPDDKIVIADAKRGDISSTAGHYAKAFFEKMDVDAITLNPLMGFETLEPFLGNDEKGIYVLTLTSNFGARDLLLQDLSNGSILASHIAKNLALKQKDTQTEIGMVIGATQPEELTSVIAHHHSGPLLIPGVGKQGGSIGRLGAALENHEGIPLINSSRSIIYAGKDKKNWEEHVARAAKGLKQKLSPITEVYV